SSLIIWSSMLYPHSCSSLPTQSAHQRHQLSDFNQQILKGMTAGILAAAISKSAVAPMDRVKLVLQLQTITSRAEIAICHRQPYQGIYDCFRRLCAEQGFRSLWRGNSATVIRCIPNQALNMLFRDKFRITLLDGIDWRDRPFRFVLVLGSQSPQSLSCCILGNLAAGGAGGALTLLVVYPLDLARTRLAVERVDSVRSISQCFSLVSANEGLPGLYRGFCASLVFTVVSRAVFFGIFDSIRLSMDEQRRRRLSFFTTWSLAQASLIVSSLLCYPLDTVRRHLMMEAGQSKKLYKNQFECWKGILYNEGPRALYKGALTNSLRCTSGALILAVYYEVLKYL
uniref:ADP/ATP translocase n=2 Tax=Meloidogyne TaxID=189290 RepID=A0A915NUH2_9BILA